MKSRYNLSSKYMIHFDQYLFVWPQLCKKTKQNAIAFFCLKMYMVISLKTHIWMIFFSHLHVFTWNMTFISIHLVSPLHFSFCRVNSNPVDSSALRPMWTCSDLYIPFCSFFPPSWGHAHRESHRSSGVLLPHFRPCSLPQRRRHLLSLSGEKH